MRAFRDLIREGCSQMKLTELARRSRMMLALPLLALPMMAQAETPVTYSDDGKALFSFAVPDFWQLRTGGIRNLTGPVSGEDRAVSRLMGMEPVAEDGIWMGLISPHRVSSVSEGLTYLSEVGKFLVEDVTLGARNTRRIGGREATTVAGTGVRNGQGVSFTAAVIPLGGQRVAVAVVVMENDVDPALVDDVNTVFTSFKSKR